MGSYVCRGKTWKRNRWSRGMFLSLFPSLFPISLSPPNPLCLCRKITIIIFPLPRISHTSQQLPQKVKTGCYTLVLNLEGKCLFNSRCGVTCATILFDCTRLDLTFNEGTHQYELSHNILNIFFLCCCLK